MFLVDLDEQTRKQEACERRLVYENNIEGLLKTKIVNDWFDDPTVKARVSRFAFLGNSEGLFRRVVNEQARTVYAIPPTRLIEPVNEQDRFAELAKEVGLDGTMDSVTHQLVAHNDVVTYTRYVADEKRIAIDVLTPDMVTIVPSPNDITRPLAFIYCRKTYNPNSRKIEDWHVFWDDEVAFLMDARYMRVPWPGTTTVEVKHGLRRLPFNLIRRWKPSGKMWNRTEGNSLIAAHFICALCRILGIRVLKAKVGKIPVISGENVKNFPRNQPLDEEGYILCAPNTTVTPIDLQTSTDGYTDFAEKVRGDAAADHGISRARLGQSGNSDDTGLQEGRADIIKIMEPAEGDEFDILRMVSQEHDDDNKRLSDAARMAIQYGDWQYRVDPEKELAVWRERRRQGVGNVLEQIMARYRDVQTVQEAMQRLLANVEIESEWVRVIRALQIPEDAGTDNPGMSPGQAGALGTEVRDGRMTPGEAMDMAQQTVRKNADPNRLREIARRVLGKNNNAA